MKQIIFISIYPISFWTSFHVISVQQVVPDRNDLSADPVQNIQYTFVHANCYPNTVILVWEWQGVCSDGSDQRLFRFLNSLWEMRFKTKELLNFKTFNKQ